MNYAPRTGTPRRTNGAMVQERRDRLQWEMDFRFVREVERLEREGAIPNRTQVEGDLLMIDWGIARVRSGTVSVSPVQITLFWTLYGADISFILKGKRIATTPGSALDPSEKRGNSVWHTYKETARWKIGPRPETHANYYPPDPENKGWTPPKGFKSVASYRDKAEPEAGDGE